MIVLLLFIKRSLFSSHPRDDNEWKGFDQLPCGRFHCRPAYSASCLQVYVFSFQSGVDAGQSGTLGPNLSSSLSISQFHGGTVPSYLHTVARGDTQPGVVRVERQASDGAGTERSGHISQL